MGSVYLSPGINIKESDFSFFVTQVSTSNAAFIGVAEKGPVNVVTLVTSWEQFVKTFGTYITAGWLAYAARSFFDNGGNILYVTRILHYSDITDPATGIGVKSNITLVDRAGSPLDTLKVEAINEGVWGDSLSVEIEAGTVDSVNEFNLIVKLDNNQVEKFENLSMVDASAKYVETLINEVSLYITVTDQDSITTTPDDMPAIGSSSLTSGDDGLTGLADTDYVGDSASKTGFYANDAIDALNVIGVPGIATATVAAGGNTYATNRQDLLYLLETPLGESVTEAVTYRTTTITIDSSYSALYWPWIQITDPLTSQKKFIPPIGAVAGRIANNDKVSSVWNAPAGVSRGRILNVIGLEYETNRSERDVLYPEGINVIARFVESGINIWGQKTLQKTPSATDRINVRRLMMFLEESIGNSSQFVTFEPNDERTWKALIRLIEPFLQGIQNARGLFDFRVQCDSETNPAEVIDRNELVCRIFVKPTKTAEFIELNFIMVATGTTFEEVL